jgi:hypothetical protein
MNRIIKAAAIAAIAAVGVIGTAGAASAYTTNTDGSVFITKGEVQSALNPMDNAKFDQAVRDGTLHFTGTAAVEYHTRYTYTVGDQSWSYEWHMDYAAGTATAEPVRNAGNGKQVTGFKMTPGEQGDYLGFFTVVNDSTLSQPDAFAAAQAAADAAGTTWTTSKVQWTEYDIHDVAVDNTPLTPTL